MWIIMQTHEVHMCKEKRFVQATIIHYWSLWIFMHYWSAWSFTCHLEMQVVIFLKEISSLHMDESLATYQQNSSCKSAKLIKNHDSTKTHYSLKEKISHKVNCSNGHIFETSLLGSPWSSMPINIRSSTWRNVEEFTSYKASSKHLFKQKSKQIKNSSKQTLKGLSIHLSQDIW
jgi:hypothetical protein